VAVLDTIAEICRRNEDIRDFWSYAGEWAPPEASTLLAKSRLDWQAALSHCLMLWISENHPNERQAGAVILGWANLGALVEGTLKWFLSVYRNQVPDDAIKRYRDPIGPEEATLEQLRVFYTKHHVWINEAERRRWDPWIRKVRDRRNAVHAYRDRDIGTFEDLHDGIERYLELLSTLEGRVPYPDDF
jgi:hypothetical protein